MNQILTLHPYKYYGQWVFDDETVGLKREAFVSGIDVMLDKLTAYLPNADKGHTLLFSSDPFPGHQVRLDWLRCEYSGNWYRCESLNQDGWLCPALFKYFDQAPMTIYAMAKESK